MGHQGDINWLDLIVAEKKTLGDSLSPKSPTHVSRFDKKNCGDITLTEKKKSFSFNEC